MRLDNEENGSCRSAEIRFLVVSDAGKSRVLLERILVAAGFCGLSCNGAGEALAILRSTDIQVVLADLNMPGSSGMKLLAEVRMNFPEVAFVMITGSDGIHQVIRAIQAGASDYLVKPLHPDALVASVRRAAEVKHLECRLEERSHDLDQLVRFRSMQLKRTLRLVKKTFDGSLQMLGVALDLRDCGTVGHCERVTRCSHELAKTMKCTPAELKKIVRGAFLHDIGKIGIPDSILRKPGPLNDQERMIIETHVQIGFDLVRHISLLQGAAEIVLTHHERFDGKGYPQGLAGADIPLGARTFAVADAFDAMTSDRPYRKALPYFDARDEITRQSGRQFDPLVVDAFLSLPEQLWQEIRCDVEAERARSNQESWNFILRGTILKSSEGRWKVSE